MKLLETVARSSDEQCNILVEALIDLTDVMAIVPSTAKVSIEGIPKVIAGSALIFRGGHQIVVYVDIDALEKWREEAIANQGNTGIVLDRIEETLRMNLQDIAMIIQKGIK